jgi:hypothetical protein
VVLRLGAILAAHPVTRVRLTGGDVPGAAKAVTLAETEYHLLVGSGEGVRRSKPVRLPSEGVPFGAVVRAALLAEWPGVEFKLPTEWH